MQSPKVISLALELSAVDPKSPKIPALLAYPWIPIILEPSDSVPKIPITELDLSEWDIIKIDPKALPDGLTDLYLNKLPEHYTFPESLRRLFLKHHKPEVELPTSIFTRVHARNTEAILRVWNSPEPLHVFVEKSAASAWVLEYYGFDRINRAAVNAFGLRIIKCSFVPKPAITASLVPAIEPTPKPTRTVIDAEWYERQLASSAGYDYDAVEAEIERIMVELKEEIRTNSQAKILHDGFNGIVTVKKDANIIKCPNDKIRELVQERLPVNLCAFVNGDPSYRGVSINRHMK